MPADAVTVRCPSCSLTWTVSRRPDGTLPKTARCASYRGGCGHIVKVPRRASSPKAAPGTPAAAAAVWEPPSEPRGFADAGGMRSDCCDAPAKIEPRGTALWCMGCGEPVTPAAVLAPYERGTEVTRAAKSQRERDLEALQLAGRRGTMLGQLRRLADDDRLDDSAVMKVEWFADEVRAAKSGARLDELVELFAAEQIKPRGRFQRPAAITAGYADDEADDGQADEDGTLAPPPGIAGQPQRATWGDAFAANGWRIAPPRGDGACQVAERGGYCVQPIGGHPPVTDALMRDGWTCSGHYYALAKTTASINRARGFT